jgi:hypothetical protein
MKKLLYEMMELRLLKNPQIKKHIKKLEQEVMQGKITAYAAAQQIMAWL